MRKVFNIFAIVFFSFSTQVLFSLSLAVIPVEPLGVEKNIAVVVTELVKADLSSKGMFELIERERLDAILKEQELQLSDITEKDNAVKVGSLLNVNKILFGTIGLYSSSYLKYFLSLRLVDVERGSIDAVANVGIRSRDDLENGVKKAVEKLISGMSFSGEVENVKGNIIYTSFGSAMGARPGMNLAVYRVIPIRDKSGKVFMNDKIPVANVVVESVTKTGSRCKVVESGGKLEVGLVVERGRVQLEKAGVMKSSITVKSIPENAKVFLNSQFIGVTPLKIDTLDPGVYRIEIRAAGYKVYSGKLTLKRGRHLVIEKELEPVLEIEDMLLLGRVPKKKSDPMKAVMLGLVPGLGENYVGYGVTAVAVPFSIFVNATIAVISNSEIAKQESHNLLVNNYTRYTFIYTALAISTYLYSILDSFIQAGSNFIYPTPVEVFLGVEGGYINQSESGDGAVTVPMDSMNYLSCISIVIRSRPLYFSVGLKYGEAMQLIMVDTVLRYPVFDGIFVGAGVGLYNNIKKPSDVEISDISSLEPLPGDIIVPQLVVSYEGTRVEGDVFISPLTYGSEWIFYYNPGDSWTSSMFSGGLTGYMARINLSYFINLRFGINADFLYVHLSNNDKSLVDENLLRINNFQYLAGNIGLIFRF